MKKLDQGIKHHYSSTPLYKHFIHILQAKSLTLLTQSYQLHDALEDMAKFVDLLFGTSSISSLIKHMPQLKGLPTLMNNMPKWIGTITQLKTVDTAR